MIYSYIDHNALDKIQFDDLLNDSIILQRYLKEGTRHFECFDSLLQDIFHMHYKYSIYLNPPQSSSVNFEIIQSMLKMGTLSSLRKRTIGSTTNTYLAFKLILDRLFETLRGRSLIQDIEKSLKLLNEMKDLKSAIEHFKNMMLAIDLDQVFSKRELDLLAQYVNEYNNRNTSIITENDWLKSLVDVVYDTSESQGDMLMNNQINTSINKSSAQKNNTATQTLLKNLIKQLQDQSELETSKDQTDIELNDEATGDEFKEYLKDELEEKFAPYLKEQYLIQGQNKNGKGNMVSELDLNDSTDKIIIKTGKVSASEQAVQHTVHKISGALENQLRQKQHFNQSSSTDLSIHINMPYSEANFKLIENTLKSQIKKLNLPRILSQALDGVDAFRNTTKVLGINENSLVGLTFDEVIKMYKRYKKPSFIKFINKVGKNKLYASRIQYSKKKEHSIPIDKVASSHNIDLLIEDEYIELALGIEAFENDFYDRYLRDDLLTIDMIRKYDKRKGPIILCYDGSGSMEGVKIEETQSHILAIMEIAKIQNRHLVLIQFASSSEPLYIKEINPTNITAQDILDILDKFICGGTDFEKPLSKAIEYIKADQHKKSDILFITDGQCEIREQFKKSFLLLKQQREFKLYTIIMHAYTYHDYGDIGDISDEVLEIKGQDIANWNEATNKKLYSLI